MLDVKARPATVVDLLQIRPQHLRSVQIERDYGDPAASLHYVVTPFVESVFERLGQSLEFCSTARAWRLTGDYGSGKSSLMLAFARHAAGLSDQLPSELRSRVSPARLEPVLVVGDREPVATSLVRALTSTVERTRKTPPRALVRRLREAGAADPSGVVSLVAAIGDWLRTEDIAAGVLIIFDELGKNLEFAASSPNEGDLQLLQHLAEAAARSGASPMVIVSILHQAVTAYARDLPSLERREWEKVSGRFEEILYAPPIEQSFALVAAALAVNEGKLPQAVARQARSDMENAVAAGWYGAGASSTQLEASAPALVPFDAFVLPVLSRLLRRFGQNERSLFSFLSSAEPGGLLAHARQPLEPYRPYRLHHLYDYFAQNLGSALQSGTSSVRWSLIDGVVRSSAAQSPLAMRILKTVGLINLLDDPAFTLTPSLILAAVVDRGEAAEAEGALARLRNEARILYDRGAGGGLCLWPHTSVDLQEAFEKGLAAVGQGGDLVTALRPVLSTEPLVARRHYVETGTMRHFEVHYVAGVSLASRLREPVVSKADGQVLLALARSEREREEAIKVVAAHDAWPKTLIVGISQPIGDVAPLQRDLEAWKWVASETPALAGDRLAREEVSRQIALAKDRLRRVLGALTDFRGGGAVTAKWTHRGQPVQLKSGRDLIAFLSCLCDEAFSNAPRITNELLNRRQLSSAAARARTTLIERLAQASDQPLLGLDPTHMPPELAAYQSILRAGGVHVCRDDRWQIVRPDPDPLNIAPALDKIGEVLRREEDRRVPFLEIADALRGPDYGIRDGLIPLLVAVYLAAYWHHTAVYEEGSYLEQVGGPEFARMLKEPEYFTIQHCAIEGVRTAVFKRLAAVVGVGEAVKTPDLLDVVRPLMQFIARLPDHARRTRNLSVTAAAVRSVLVRVQDPTAMLFTDLPKACGLEPFSAAEIADEERLEAFVTAIAKSVRELHAAYPALLDRISEALARSLDASGPADELQDVLSSRSGPLVEGLAEPELKSFALRLADRNLAPKLWLESIASFLARKPPERWGETDEREFHHRLKLLSRRFTRVEAAARDGVDPDADRGTPVLRLVITASDGRELEDLLRAPTGEEQLEVLERDFGALLDRHGRAGMLAMARALLSRAQENESDIN